MPSGKHKLIMVKATVLIHLHFILTSFLTNGSSFDDCIMVLLKLIAVLLCAPFFSPLHIGDGLRYMRCRISAVLAGTNLTLVFVRNITKCVQSSWK